jgi:hypothetical protein
MVETIKFSEFTDGGDLEPNQITVGLDNTLTINTRFTNAFPLLPPGTTAERPAIAPSMYYRLRFNTSSIAYEYYEPLSATWVELSSTGSILPLLASHLPLQGASLIGIQDQGGVLSKTVQDLANSHLISTIDDGTLVNGVFLSALATGFLSSTIVSGALASRTFLGTTNQINVANGDGSANPIFSLSSTLNAPGTFTIQSTTAISAIINDDTMATALATNIPTALSVKNYVDSSVGGAVTSIIGTANQVLANGISVTPQTGAVTLTLPQSIATSSAVQFASVQFSTNNGLLDLNGDTLLAFSPRTTPVDYLTLFNGNGVGHPALQSNGSNTNIGLVLQTKGTGTLQLSSASTTAPISFSTGTTYQHNTQFNFANTAATRTATFQDSDGTVAWTSQLPTPAALTKTDDTNVTLTLGGTPATALLQATSLTLGWTGQLALTRGGTNASLTASNGGIVYSTATAMAILSGTATAGQHLQSGASGAPSWTTATFPSTATGTGTVLRANGTNWVASTATFADTYAASTLLYSNGTNTVTGLPTANSASLVTNSSGVPVWSSTMTNGQLIIGSTGSTPTAATLTAGTGVSITNAAASITITATGGGLAWSTIAGTTQAAAVNNGYVAGNAAQTTVTLPATAAVGDIVGVEGLGAAGWILAANTGQTIKIGSSTTSSAGSLTSAAASDNVYVTCIVANTTWRVRTTNSAGLTIA